jgi:hypothetical protein
MKIRLKSGEELNASGVSFEGKRAVVTIHGQKKTILRDDIEQIDEPQGKEVERWL